MQYLSKKLRIFRVAPLLTVVGCLVALLYAAPAHAQASRTWVSGVGDDANPCSRTAPCKTFAGAISKTAAGGEINCLDSAGYGAVTITKGISIVCNGVVGSVLVPGTNGIVVQAGPSDIVILRGIEINGIGTGINGVRFLSGKALQVDTVNIYGFTTNGIDVALGATGSSVEVKNTDITNVGQVGIRITTTSGGVSLDADRVNISRVTTGVEAALGGNGTVSRSTVFGAGNGVTATANGAILTVANSVLASNNIGANATVSGATVALAATDLFANNTAVNAVAGSNFITGQDNKLSSNGTPGALPSANMITR